jgi:hypothetical protein
MLRYGVAAGIVVIGLCAASAASATVETINLTADHCTGGCLSGGGTGSVSVNDAGGVLAFDVVLTGNLVFQFDNGKGSGLDAFVFNLKAGDSPITFTDITPGFHTIPTGGTESAGSFHQDGFGTFEYALSYANPKPNPRDVQELKFTVSDGGTLTVGDLASNIPGGWLMSADVFSNNVNSPFTGNGNTGPIGGSVGAITRTTSVPEPSTWAMMIIGLLGVGLAGRRKVANRLAAFGDPLPT